MKKKMPLLTTKPLPLPEDAVASFALLVFPQSCAESGITNASAPSQDFLSQDDLFSTKIRRDGSLRLLLFIITHRRHHHHHHHHQNFQIPPPPMRANLQRKRRKTKRKERATARVE